MDAFLEKQDLDRGRKLGVVTRLPRLGVVVAPRVPVLSILVVVVGALRTRLRPRLGLSR
jgi:hypothetical protein